MARVAALLALVAGALAVVAIVGASAGVEVVRSSQLDASSGRPVATPTPQVIPAPALRPTLLRQPSAGLGIVDRGLRIAVASPVVDPGERRTVRFRLAGGGGAERVALTVVRRDGRFLERPAARREGGGDWAADVSLARPGTYRLIADVDDGRRVVGTDLFAPGAFLPLALPAPATLTTVGGYAVRLRRSGRGLRLAVQRGEQAVDVRAAGPAVAVRAGDLAYASAAPTGGRGGRALRFSFAYPGPGAYRVFVPFIDGDGGRLVTAAFTRTAGAGAGATQRSGRSG